MTFRGRVALRSWLAVVAFGALQATPCCGDSGHEELREGAKETEIGPHQVLPAYAPHSVRKKRLTMDFNGVYVSYPQYLGLMKLQEKVIRLGKMMDMLHLKYSREELSKLPQYKRLIALHTALLPLLPQDETDTESVSSEGETGVRSKRSSITMDFMGNRVSYPQYLRLKTLQAKTIEMDQLMRSVLKRVSLDFLETTSQWQTLTSMYRSMKKLLPEGYLEKIGELPIPPANKRSLSMEFNGVHVSYPQYLHLKEYQKKVVMMDRLIKALAEASEDPESLEKLPKWRELVALRDSLSKLLPEGYESYKLKKRAWPAALESNGVQVSLPQHQQVKLDDVALRMIASEASPETLAANPNWSKVAELRSSLESLFPDEHDDRR